MILYGLLQTEEEFMSQLIEETIGKFTNLHYLILVVLNKMETYPLVIRKMEL